MYRIKTNYTLLSGFLAILFCLSFNRVVALPDSSSVTVVPMVMSGQIALSFGKNTIADKSALFISFGGPGLSLKSGDWSFSLNMLPSLRWQQDDIFRPNLGFGASFGYKRFILVVPFYFEAAGTRREIFPTLGIGYKF